MAAINDLVAQIKDEALRQQIEAELKRVMKHKKFGLVFEEHLPPASVECIYIDPPYNTGAKDWKYNNDYMDTVDTYRHLPTIS